MASDQLHAARISTRNIHEDLNQKSKLCDTRIEDAYMRLSTRYGDKRPSSPTKSHQFEKRTVSSSLNLPVRKYVEIDDFARPSSAQGHRTKDHLHTERPRGILKITQSPEANSRKTSRESPDQWFQRIMHVNKLSPLDLCEVFSYGDARKHPMVPLSHVCEVLFDLDPATANGADPVTEEMEEFLYQFATDQGDKLLVNIKEALRALDIWQSRVAQVSPLHLTSDPQSKAAILESKNRKLMSVISGLKDENLRLSRQLESTKLSEEKALSTTIKSSNVEVSPEKLKSTSPTKTTALATSITKLKIVNLHETELIEIASKMQFSGVKHLEELLKEGDVESTGYVDLQQLCNHLADQFQLIISEPRLIEVCMGMRFNSSAQLDYKEFIDVLLDILIYALPDIRESAKRKSLSALDKYLQSGFPQGREHSRKLLDALCSKYDLNGDYCISIKELTRVFHNDLVKRYNLELPFPLEEDEILQLAQPFLQKDECFLNYSDFLDAILGPFPYDLNLSYFATKQLKRGLKWKFWHNIYIVLCGGDSRREVKVLSQLSKILIKVDPNQTFTISTRHFQRIFDRHISPDDMEVVVSILAMPDNSTEESEWNPKRRILRYDVMLKLIFGSPELNDEHFFNNHIRRNLLREQKRIQLYISELINAKGETHKLKLPDFYDIFVRQAEMYPISFCAVLFLFSSIDCCHDGIVEVKTLKSFLSKWCWKIKDCTCSNNRADSTDTTQNSSFSNNFNSIERILAKACTANDFQRVLDNYSDKTDGWISSTDLLKELMKMLRELAFVDIQQENLNKFTQRVIDSSKFVSNHTTRPRIRDAIYCDLFFDTLFDWDALIFNLRLPNSLVEIEKVFARFDWDHIGSIRCEDWNKAYRVICHEHQSLAAWEIRVLQRRFPDNSKEKERDTSIDYACLLVYLLACQQRQERKRLQDRVMNHFQQKFTTQHHQNASAEAERLFRSLDTENKGYFTTSDMKAYLTREFNSGGDIPELNNVDALAAVMHLLANVDNSNKENPVRGSRAKTVVTLDRFLTIANLFSADKSSSASVSNSKRLGCQRTIVSKGRQDDQSDEGNCSTISSLRVLELKILEIATEFADLKGNILPVQAFRYLSYGPKPLDIGSKRKKSSSSPFPQSVLHSPTSKIARLSVTSPSQKHVLDSVKMDPLTPTKLKQFLQTHHNLDVSTHLISQFFLHIGSPSKSFLDLMHFAKWAAPLSTDLKVRARDAVKQMIIKGKGGGGKVDLDKFLIQLKRRIQNSPQNMVKKENGENVPLQFVSMPTLLSKLHQLDIPLHKQELIVLFRHFGMEDDLEAVDYALFLQRLYEL